MSAEIDGLRPCEPQPPDGPRCKYCRRVLVEVAASPLEIERHCSSRGCRWCQECYAGQTSVSPVRLDKPA